jgi:hypothetical protein
VITTLFVTLLRAYPRTYRAEFDREMAEVFQEAAQGRRDDGRLSYARFVLEECLGLLVGAALEWFRHFRRAGRIAAAISAMSGAAVAAVFHILLYTVLVPHAHAQNRTAAADQQALEVVTTLIRNTFTALHNAKTKEDIAKLVDDMEAPDWVSIDPNGYTVLTHDEEVRTLEGFLSVDPDKRPSNSIEVLWAHAEPWRITAVYLVVHGGDPFRSKTTFGTAPEARFVLEGTLSRDTFARTPQGWRRIRHEKLLPDQFQQIQGDSVVSAPTAR